MSPGESLAESHAKDDPMHDSMYIEWLYAWCFLSIQLYPNLDEVYPVLSGFSE